LPWVNDVQTYGEALHILVKSAQKSIPKIEKVLEKESVQFFSLRQAPPRMEEAFISLIRGLEK
jgi:hypothetical protein